MDAAAGCSGQYVLGEFRNRLNWLAAVHVQMRLDSLLGDASGALVAMLATAVPPLGVRAAQRLAVAVLLTAAYCSTAYWLVAGDVRLVRLVVA